MVSSKYRKPKEKVYNAAYLSFHYSRAWVRKTTHGKATKLSKRLRVPVTEVYDRAINGLLLWSKK